MQLAVNTSFYKKKTAFTGQSCKRSIVPKKEIVSNSFYTLICKSLFWLRIQNSTDAYYIRTKMCLQHLAAS